MDKIDWYSLSENPYTISLLDKNVGKFIGIFIN